MGGGTLGPEETTFSVAAVASLSKALANMETLFSSVEIPASSKSASLLLLSRFATSRLRSLESILPG